MKKVVVLPGDDAAGECVLAVMPLLDSLSLPIEWQVLACGESLRTELADAADTVLFGGSNGTTQGLAYLRAGWGTYANVRPVKWRRGVPAAIRAPEAVDYVIVRECLEDLYVGIEGELYELAAGGFAMRTLAEKSGVRLRYPVSRGHDGRYCLKLYTREGVTRVATYAARLALERRAAGYPGRVTIGGKWNVNPVTDGFFRRVSEEVVSAYPELRCDACLADALARQLVTAPCEYDVILLPNLIGDILSDVGAGTVGGLGIAPSGSYGEDRAYFEPVHGSVPELAGQHAINPAATLLSAAMMLRHLGFPAACERLEAALGQTLASGTSLTPDLGGRATTTEMVAAVRERYGA